MKKFLSLVLALVMTMSLVTVSAGATDFTDADDIQYIEAVDVMTAIKVVDGDTAGNFNPQNGLTRGAAAKIICNLILGPTTAAELNADTNPYPDVDKDSVFAGYIAYCAKEGIVGGYADGTFKPANPLTGYAFMKMLLGALGYDATKEGYVGANWSINVAKQAIGIGLNKGLVEEFNGSDYVTREEAMLYAFNTLKATMVQYVNDSKVTVGDVTIETNSKADYVADIPGRNYNGATAGSESEETLQFAEKYFSNLTVETAYDDLQNPLNKWKIKSDVVGYYTKAADQVLVVKEGNKSVYDVLVGSTYGDYADADLAALGTPVASPTAVTSYVNGVQTTWNTNVITSVDGEALNKGDVVYVYENTDGDVARVVVARYSYAKIDSVATNMSATEKNNGASYRIKLVDINGNVIGTYYDDHDTNARVLNGFDADTYVKDTVLAVAAGAAIEDSYVAESVTGKLDSAKEYSATNSQGFVTINGQKCEFANPVGTNVVAGIIGNYDFDNSYTAYLTAEGYAFAVEGAEATKIDDLYYVTSIFGDVTGGETKFYAQRVSMDGVVEIVEIETGAFQAMVDNETLTKDTNYNHEIGGAQSIAWAGLYTFNDKGYNKADLTTGESNKQFSGNKVLTIIPFDDSKVPTASAMYVNYGEDDFVVTGNTGRKTDGTTVTTPFKSADTKMATGAGTFYMNAETKYIGVEGVGGAIDVKASVGGMTVNNTSDKVLVIRDDVDTKTVLGFVIVGADLRNVTGSTANVVYQAGTATERTSDLNYKTNLYHMEDGRLEEGAILDAAGDQGFYTYSQKDSVYTTHTGAENLNSLGGTYDDETGYLMNAVLTVAYDKKGVSYVEIDNTATTNFGAIKLVGATIIDNRSEAAIDADPYYPWAITTVADLKEALKVSTIVADVYFDDGVTFVAVDALSVARVDVAGRDTFASDPLEVGEIVFGDETDMGAAAGIPMGDGMNIAIGFKTTAANQAISLEIADEDGNVVYWEEYTAAAAVTAGDKSWKVNLNGWCGAVDSNDADGATRGGIWAEPSAGTQGTPATSGATYTVSITVDGVETVAGNFVAP